MLAIVQGSSGAKRAGALPADAQPADLLHPFWCGGSLHHRHGCCRPGQSSFPGIVLMLLLLLEERLLGLSTAVNAAYISFFLLLAFVLGLSKACSLNTLKPACDVRVYQHRPGWTCALDFQRLISNLFYSSLHQLFAG